MSIDVGRRPVLLDALDPVMAVLESAGIRATLDIAQLNPPGCLMSLPELEFRFQGGDYTATYRLIAVVGSTDASRAVANLSDYLAQVLVALGDRPVSGRPVNVTLADASTTIPGYELSWTSRIRRR